MCPRLLAVHPEMTITKLPPALTTQQKERRRALVVPREHGAWGMLLVPLVTGAAVGFESGGKVSPVLLLTAAVLALFWLRTPAESWLGTGIVRAQTPEERKHVARFILLLTAIAAASLSLLFWQGKNLELLAFGMVAGVAFTAQMFLKKRGRSTRMVAELVGALALTVTAPAAYFVATGRLDAKAWTLWLVNWLFAANQIHFVWMTIRGARASGWPEKIAAGWSFLIGQLLLVASVVFICYFRWLPALTLIAFAPIVFRGSIWFAKRPAPVVLRRLGWTEMAHAIVFGVLLTAGFYSWR
jgi:hypothetical protein